MRKTTETTIPLLVIEQRQQHVTSSEVGPKGVRKIELRIGDLPEQEIADSRFTARSNKEVRVRKTGRGEVLFESGFMHAARGLAALNVVDQVIDGVDNLGASSITQGDHYGSVGEMLGLPGDDLRQILGGRRKLVKLADGEKPYFSFMKGLPFLKKEFFKERHQQVDLSLGAVPVFLRERIDRDDGNPQQVTGIEDFADGNQPFPVSGNTGQPTLGSPTTVPIHNHGHVTGQRVLVELGKEIVLREFREGMC